MKLVIIYMIWLGAIPIFAQSSNINDELINSISELRSSILERNSESIIELEKLLTKWSNFEKNDSIVSYLATNISYSARINNLPFGIIKKEIKRRLPNTKIRKKISRHDVKVLKDNFELLSLCFDGYLEAKPPFNISVDSAIIADIEFIYLEENDSILDIGSGIGNHIMFAALLHPNNNYFLNEIDKSLIKYLKHKLISYESILNGIKSIQIIRGSEKNLNLSDKVNKIIVRNSFHHFRHKQIMLKEVKNIISNNGTIIFIEGLKTKMAKQDECNFKMDYEDIMKYINRFEFIILEEKILNNILYLKCKIKS